jgi:hypothetical protein
MTGIGEQHFRKENISPQYLWNDRFHYQRHIDQERVRNILKKKMKSQKDRRIIAARRMDGTYWIINGQHHNEAYLRAGIDKVKVWVFDSTGWGTEATIFNYFQKQQMKIVK